MKITNIWVGFMVVDSKNLNQPVYNPHRLSPQKKKKKKLHAHPVSSKGGVCSRSM